MLKKPELRPTYCTLWAPIRIAINSCHPASTQLHPVGPRLGLAFQPVSVTMKVVSLVTLRVIFLRNQRKQKTEY